MREGPLSSTLKSLTFQLSLTTLQKPLNMQIKSLAIAVISTASVVSASAYGEPSTDSVATYASNDAVVADVNSAYGSKDSVVADEEVETYGSTVAVVADEEVETYGSTDAVVADEEVETYGSTDSVVADEEVETYPAPTTLPPVYTAPEDDVKADVGDEGYETPCPTEEVAAEDEVAYTEVPYESVADVANEEGVPTPCPTTVEGYDAVAPVKHLRPTPAPTVSYNDVEVVDNVLGVEYATAGASNVAIGIVSMVLPIVVYML